MATATDAARTPAPSTDRDRAVAGIDLGGTKILVGVVDGSNRLLARSKRPTPAKEGGDAILATMVDAVREAAAAAGVAVADLVGIGVGSPGPLDVERGVILQSANLSVRDFPLGPGLSKATGRPVLVRNDVRMGGYGEFRLGAGKGRAGVLVAFVGTGLGGCVVVDGRVVTGSTGNAGELGHMIVKANGPRCGCGRRGCLESLASKMAITRRVAKAIRQGHSTTLETVIQSRSSKLKSRELKAAFEAGDDVAVREVRRAAHYLGLGLGGLVNVVGPEVVVLGGGVATSLGDPFVRLVTPSLRSQALTDPDQTVEVVLASLGDDSGVLGAALMARETFSIARTQG